MCTMSLTALHLHTLTNHALLMVICMGAVASAKHRVLLPNFRGGWDGVL